MRAQLAAGVPTDQPAGQTVATGGRSVGQRQPQQQQIDPEDGLTYMRARYYDPELGRFIMRDSNSGIPTLTQTQNRYTYATNGPVNYQDPDGHWVLWDCRLSSLVVVGAVFTLSIRSRTAATKHSRGEHTILVLFNEQRSNSAIIASTVVVALAAVDRNASSPC